MRSKHMLILAFYCLFLTSLSAQTINTNDMCWDELAPMRGTDTLTQQKIDRYQQCMRQVGYTKAQASKLFGNYSCFPTHNDTFLKKHPAYCPQNPDG